MGYRSSAYSHQIFHSTIWVVETGSHGPLNFLARKTHINHAVDCGRESRTGQETATRTTCCRWLVRLFCRRLNRLRSGFSSSGLDWLNWLGWLHRLDWLRRSGSARGSNRCGFSLRK